eukprot:gene2146-2565_t
MEEGPDSPRQTFLQRSSTLHSAGGKFMYYNDDMGRGGCPFLHSNILSHCEANHAIKIMNETISRGENFFMQLWFYAPHGPWEIIPQYRHLYPDMVSKGMCVNGMPGRNCREEEYMTMISAMDGSVGMVLQALRQLGIDNNTIVVFTSDNGPEDFAGGTAGFRGRKRSLMEGGIRVPTIWQWPGVIPAGRILKVFGVNTDILPTMMEAAGLKPAAYPSLRLDGVSLLRYFRTEKSSALSSAKAIGFEKVAEADGILNRVDKKDNSRNERKRVGTAVDTLVLRRLSEDVRRGSGGGKGGKAASLSSDFYFKAKT